jgi:hypothetical protein
VATTTPEDEKREKSRPYWHLEDGDKRVLYITVIGGLAANIGLVLIVGLGLALTHVIHRYHLIGQTGISALASFIGGIGVLAQSAVTTKHSRTRTASVAALFVLAAILILALVGYAAGVK